MASVIRKITDHLDVFVVACCKILLFKLKCVHIWFVCLFVCAYLAGLLARLKVFLSHVSFLYSMFLHQHLSKLRTYILSNCTAAPLNCTAAPCKLEVRVRACCCVEDLAHVFTREQNSLLS